MKQLSFILLNLIMSTNLPIWIILTWNYILNIGDSIDIMAYTGIAYVLFSVFYGIFKLEIFSFFVKYSQFFKYTSKLLNNIKCDPKLRNNLLISVFIIDILFLVLAYFAFKNLGWNTKALPFLYLFSLGGALTSYLSFLVTPWIEKRFKN